MIETEEDIEKLDKDKMNLTQELDRVQKEALIWQRKVRIWYIGKQLLCVDSMCDKVLAYSSNTANTKHLHAIAIFIVRALSI